MSFQIINVEQGSQDWLSLRKTKITATDASAIMGSSPWKTRSQLYHEKISNEPPMRPNARMQRGIDLEPIARNLFNIQTGWNMQPAVAVKDFTMASFDGRDESIGSIVEIKCPGEKDHNEALLGKVPTHYYSQLQHQMYVAGVCKMYYFSFDGMDGITIQVKRDDEFIDKMIVEEKKFYDCLMSRTLPEPAENEYTQREDALWQQYASRWQSVTKSIKELEKEEEILRNHLIILSGDCNSKGAGISLLQVQRKGNVDYGKIPQLKGIDLDQYRKGTTNSWRITLS